MERREREKKDFGQHKKEKPGLYQSWSPVYSRIRVFCSCFCMG